MAAAPRHAARPALERVIDVQSQSEKGGRQTKRDGGDGGSCKGPAKDAPVKGKGETFAVIRQGSRRDPVGAPARDQNRADATRKRKQQGFVNQRSQQLEAGRAESAAHGEFAGACHRPREKKIGEIGAGDKQDES